MLFYLLVYVDYIVLTGNSPDFLLSLINQLSQTFELKDLGDLHFFLGLHIHCTPKGLFINQAKYIIDLLTKHNMLNSSLLRHLVSLISYWYQMRALFYLIHMYIVVFLAHCIISRLPGLI